MPRWDARHGWFGQGYRVLTPPVPTVPTGCDPTLLRRSGYAKAQLGSKIMVLSCSTCFDPALLRRSGYAKAQSGSSAFRPRSGRSMLY